MPSQRDEEEASANEPGSVRSDPSTASDATQPVYHADAADSPSGNSRQSGVLERRAILHGEKLGSHYVRKQFTHMEEFRRRADGVLEATERTLAPKSGVGRGVERVRRFLLGQRLATEQQEHERLTKVKALAVLSSDAISSVAYATEASLGVLIAAGLQTLQVNLVIAGCIALLMIIVGTSYRQTIHAYPNGGGSYIVAHDNLGELPGLVAAAALLIDYILTVSVSVSSGVDALVSAVPRLNGSLHLGAVALSGSVALGVLFIVIIMVVNMRGIRESGTIFAAPTYLFIGSFVIMILVGLIHALTTGGLLHAVPPTFSSAHDNGWAIDQQVGVFLILTAFASGCSAMTGVEAISNGIPAFKKPESMNAAHTLSWMVGILVTLFLGITYLAWRFGIVPVANQNPTVDSQIAHLLFVNQFGFMYYVVQGFTLLILVLAANTSFADFPRLSSILARDGYLPHQFAYRGDRLAFTTGIMVLATLSILLLIRFEGNTDALINLYALGVFTAFTLSQFGMVIRWWRRRESASPHWRRALGINLVGTMATGVVTLVITISKFDRGAWIVVILVPVLVLTFRGISHHYQYVKVATVSPTPLHPEQLKHIIIVPIAELNLPAVQSLAYACSITAEVQAIHVATDPQEEAEFRAKWDSWMKGRQGTWDSLLQNREPDNAAVAAKNFSQSSKPVNPQLVIIESPYRSMVAPLIKYIDAVREDHLDTTISVVLPEFVPAHWWERILHNQTAFRLKLALYARPGVVVINVPYHLPRSPRRNPESAPVE
ncbi:MAG: APC family permease [Ktedonobacterales bacterium]